jgi:hypothetical protein
MERKSGQMKAIGRAALYSVLPLALILAAGYSWYRLSDTGKGWRYEDKLATYCDGLIPYNESAAFTGLNTETGLSHDERHGYGDDSYNYCKVADMEMTIALIDDDAVGSGPGAAKVFEKLQSNTSDYLPVALGGGWYGYTDMLDTAVVLSCNNKPASVIVSIAGDESYDNPSEARAIAELAAATARKAAGRWSCQTEYGGRIPKVSTPSGDSSSSATGTCDGVPIDDDLAINWVKAAEASDATPLEACVLGEFGANEEALYHLEAAFGPYAQRLRSSADEPGALNADTGLSRDLAWATAACPGAPRAIFSIYATEYVDPQKSFLITALRAFAERSAARHGCTDLKLPS